MGSRRNLDLARAVTNILRADHPHAQANLALANLEIGESFRLAKKQVMVVSINEKVLVLDDGEERVSWDLFKPHWAKLVEMVAVEMSRCRKTGEPTILLVALGRETNTPG